MKFSRESMLDLMERHTTIREAIWHSFASRVFSDMLRASERFSYLGRSDRSAWIGRSHHEEHRAGEAVTLEDEGFLLVLSGSVVMNRAGSETSARAPLLVEVTEPTELVIKKDAHVVYVPPLGSREPFGPAPRPDVSRPFREDMPYSRKIRVVDSHTAGEPTRVVVDGIPPIPGKTMMEKKEWLAAKGEGLRKMLMWEPRGHRDMFGVLLTRPCSDEAHMGVIFMDSDGYLDMCGHGSIGVVTVLLETGVISLDGGDAREVPLTIDTPAGLVHARAAFSEGRVREITLRSVPSFYYGSVEIALDQQESIVVDIAYGGNFFALVKADRLGLKLERGKVEDLVRLALEIREQANRSIEVICPVTRASSRIDLVEIYEDEEDGARNLVVFGAGQADRSPCGTGTCAKMALLHHHKALKVGQTHRNRGILGTEFMGKIVKETTVDGRPAIVPEITGHAYITAVSQFVVDEIDPFREGFLLS